MRQWDDYFWPGETVLANLLGEHDKLALQDVEYDITTMAQEEIVAGVIPIDRTYDAAHLQALHRALFREVYDWAGEIRQIGISKDFTEFAPPQRIAIYLNDVARVVRDTPWQVIDRDDVVANAARVYALGNVAHPFREGNGRAMKLFTNQVVEQAGYKFDFDAIDKGVWDQRSVLSMPDLGGHEPFPGEIAPVFAQVIRELPPPPPAVDPALLEQARHAARLAGNSYPPGAAGSKQPRPHTPSPASRPRGRDADYGR